MTLKEQVYEIVSQRMKVGPGELDDDSSPDTVPLWDSMRHVDLITELEEKFEVQFTDDQLFEMMSVGAIIKVLSELKGEKQ